MISYSYYIIVFFHLDKMSFIEKAYLITYLDLPTDMVNIINEYCSQLYDVQWSLFVDNKSHSKTWKISQSQKNKTIKDALQYKYQQMDTRNITLRNRNYVCHATMLYMGIKSTFWEDVIVGKYYIQYKRNGFDEYAFITSIEEYDTKTNQWLMDYVGTLYRPYLYENYKCTDIQTFQLNDNEVVVNGLNDVHYGWEGEWMYNEDLRIWEFVINLPENIIDYQLELQMEGLQQWIEWEEAQQAEEIAYWMEWMVAEAQEATPIVDDYYPTPMVN